MPHGAGFYTLACTKCRHVFELPSLGDMTYGEVLLHGERGGVHRYVSVLDHPVWRVIEEELLAPAGASVRAWRVLAALADPVAGERLRVDAACPNCQADGTHFRTPKRAPKAPRRGEVEDATFNAFLSLPEHVRRERVAAAAAEA